MKEPRILIIDDEKTICDAIRLILSESGYAVDACTSGERGLAALQETAYDLLLLDMKLPDRDGMEILDATHTESPGTYVVVMTGYSTVKNAVEAIKRGAWEYLEKPFSDDDMLLAVNRALENKNLVEENRSLRKQLHQRYDYNNIIGESPKILRLFVEMEKVAPTEITVLIEGESGTGKELFAKAIHTHSQRASRQFVAVDCSTFSSSLLESELFGHVKGAFTGAVKDKPGIFEIADGGTMLLDEVSNLTTEIQGKLLRVMETHEYKPVGADYPKKTDVRIIAATNRNLAAMVKEGTFREDLLYRLNVFPIVLPPLRERKDDIPRLAYHFLRLFCKETGKQIQGFTDEAIEILADHAWPGNVRQLKNAVERLIIMADTPMLDGADLTDRMETKRSPAERIVPETLDQLKAIKRHFIENRYGEIEKQFLQKALQVSEGNVTRAAARVGMQRSNFHTLMKKHHLGSGRK